MSLTINTQQFDENYNEMPQAAQSMAQLAYHDPQKNVHDDEPEEPHYTEEEDTSRYPNRRSKAQRSSGRGPAGRDDGEDDGFAAHGDSAGRGESPVASDPHDANYGESGEASAARQSSSHR